MLRVIYLWRSSQAVRAHKAAFPYNCDMPLVAQKRFTDREEQRRSFLAKLATPQAPDEYRLLTFYGVGGQGKSELFRYFQNLKTDQDDLTFNAWAKKRGPLPEYHIAPLSFHILENRNPGEALIKLRGALAEAKIDFFHFDLAFSYYLKAASPNLDMKKRYPELFRGDYALFHSAADIVGVFVPAVTVLNALSKQTLQLRPRQLRWYQKTGKALENELKPLDQQELLDKLTIYFGHDLKAALAKPHTPRLVIMLDTYEALWEGKPQQTGLGAQEVDGWIRDLVSACPGVLFVFFGRDYLKWDTFSKPRKSRNYTAMLADSQHLLGGLSEADADLFLKNAGVWQAPIRQAIIASSAGLPFYLDLQLETYNEIIEEGGKPSPSDFGGHEEEVITRFLRHLNDHQENALYVLAQARRFDALLFESLKEKFLSGSPVSFVQLTRHSFIREDQQQPGQFVMHQLMREHLVEYLKREELDRYREVQQALFEYYDDIATVKNFKIITFFQEAALIEALYHKEKFNPKEISDWLSERVKPFSEADRYHLLVSLYEALGAVEKLYLGDRHPDYANTLQILADLLNNIGDSKAAELNSRQAVEITKQAFGEKSIEYAYQLSKLAQLLHAQTRYEEVELLLKDAIEIYRQAQYANHQQLPTLKALSFLCLITGRSEETEFFLKQTIQVEEEIYGKSDSRIVDSLSNYAFLLQVQGRYEEAMSFHNRIFAVFPAASKLTDIADPEFAVHLKNFGDLVWQVGRHRDAEAVYLRSIEIYKQALGETNQTYAFWLSNLADLFVEVDRYEEAEALYWQVTEIDKQTIGEMSPKYAAHILKLAHICSNVDKKEEAISLSRQAVQIYKTTLGSVSPKTQSAIMYLKSISDG